MRFVLTGGELPDQPMIDLVQAALSSETVRPLTDQVLVAAPDTVPFFVKGKWYLSETDATLLASVTQAVKSAVYEYISWQRSKPGRDINPSRLIELVVRAGAKRVELEEPIFTRLSALQIAREQEVSLEFGGVEDE